MAQYWEVMSWGVEPVAHKAQAGHSAADKSLVRPREDIHPRDELHI